MTKSVDQNEWVWVVVQSHGGKEAFLGQQEEGGASFIPLFRKKDHALMCLNLMVRDKKEKQEVQAVIYSDLYDEAAKREFMLYVLDGEGKILEKIEPDLDN
jgi:hypothetical protein